MHTQTFCRASDSGNIAWEDCAGGVCLRPEFGIHNAMMTFRDANQIPLSAFDRFEQLGRNFGVDRNIP
jgi:hypothetical protein